MQNHDDDAPSFLYALIGFLIPIVGIILFFVDRGTKPRRASSAIKGACLNIGLGVVAFFLIAILSLFGNRVKSTYNTPSGPAPAQVR